VSGESSEQVARRCLKLIFAVFFYSGLQPFARSEGGNEVVNSDSTLRRGHLSLEFPDNLTYLSAIG